MPGSTDNIRVFSTSPLPSPADIRNSYPLGAEDAEFVDASRRSLASILQTGVDQVTQTKKLIAIVGPCSIHDYDQAILYAEKLATLRDRCPSFFFVMRVYFEKPRTRGGWKGYVYDPHLDESNDIVTGLTLARKLLCEITSRFRLPIATEFLDTVSPQYFTDIVSYGAIGARTVESQVHRQLASGLSMPVGFKNRTDGDVQTAVDAIFSSQTAHSFFGVGLDGIACRIDTSGNPTGHLILRGGKGPNYDVDSIRSAYDLLKSTGPNGIVVDVSHGNSSKNPLKQLLSMLHVWRIAHFTDLPVRGIMLESNHNHGNQPLKKPLKFGVSITDACLSFEATALLFDLLQRSTLQQNIGSLTEYRDAIKNSTAFLKSPVFYGSNVFTVLDDSILSLSTDPETILLYGMRCAASDAIAEFKFSREPFRFVQKSLDVLTQLQDIDREKELLSEDPLVLPLLSISKQIQTLSVEYLLNQIKIGYLYGKGTFSYETVTNFLEGQHVSYPSFDALITAVNTGKVGLALIPVYNNIIGGIFIIPDELETLGVIHKQLKLAVYSNQSSLEGVKALFMEPHVDKETAMYRSKHALLKNLTGTEVVSTREGILKTLNSSTPTCTIASSYAECLLYKIHDDVTPHNFTTFACVRRKQHLKE
jgi:3-deoxy-7-phosphoheptulonate synthase